MPAYEMVTDSAWLEAGVARARNAAPKILRWTLKLVCFVGLAALLAVSVSARITVLSALVGFFLVLLMIGPYFDLWWWKRQLRASPYYGRTLRVDVDDSGIQMTTDLSQVRLKWPAVTKAIRFPDGFLVFTGRKETHWWPDAALVEGAVSDVEERLLAAGLLGQRRDERH